MITTVLLGVLLHQPGSSFSSERRDSLVVDKLFAYRRDFANAVDGDSANAYVRYNFRVIKRNPTLLFVPTMYYIAKGRRNYVGETYGRIKFHDVNKFDLKRQVFTSTVPHRRKTMTTMWQYVTPNLYGAALFHNSILSPFNHSNRRFYRYRISSSGAPRSCVTFTPRLRNTELVSGYAIVDNATGRILRSRFRGEHDMIAFNVNVDMGENRTDNSLLPYMCEVSAVFKFAGNEIRSGFKAFYDCPTTLPDSISDRSDMELMDILRPDTLSPVEKNAYQQLAEERAKADTTSARKPKHENRLAKMAWNVLSDNLLSSLKANNERASIRLSPIINPLYLSYSHSRGLAYKMKLGAEYRFSENAKITFNPNFGYNFKIKQFYFNSPLRYTYDSRRNGWIELSWANGNRITNSSVLDIIRDERRDTVDFSTLNLDYFKDELWKLSWNTNVTRWLSMTVGGVYHRRTGVNKAQLAALGKPGEYRSFAPFVKLSIQPSPNWPLLTGNYERSFKRALRSNTEYERWEFDASYKKHLSRLRQFNMRMGAGLYTNRSTNYFVDFDNFHEDYVPGGWDDDWSGDFQLLNSQWYNASDHYARANVSYESPMLALTWLPVVGRFIETERLYASALQIEHTRPYFELGYGFTNRYFSVGIFGSFLNGKFHDFGTKFTFELFRKW